MQESHEMQKILFKKVFNNDYSKNLKEISGGLIQDQIAFPENEFLSKYGRILYEKKWK